MTLIATTCPSCYLPFNLCSKCGKPDNYDGKASVNYCSHCGTTYEVEKTEVNLK